MAITNQFFVSFLFMSALTIREMMLLELKSLQNRGREKRQTNNTLLSNKVITFNDNGQLVDLGGTLKEGLIDQPNFVVTTQTIYDTNAPNPFPINSSMQQWEKSIPVTTNLPKQTQTNLQIMTSTNIVENKLPTNLHQEPLFPLEITTGQVISALTDKTGEVQPRPVERSQLSNIQDVLVTDNPIPKQKIKPRRKTNQAQTQNKSMNDVQIPELVNVGGRGKKVQNSLSNRATLITRINNLYAELARLTGFRFGGHHGTRLVGKRKKNWATGLFNEGVDRGMPGIGRVEFLHADDRIGGREVFERERLPGAMHRNGFQRTHKMPNVGNKAQYQPFWW